LNELSLFSGAGGGLLATKHLLGWTCKGYVENDPYCQNILRQRIADGFLDAAPVFGDINAFIGEGFAEAYQGMVDVITAGFPCQPFSVAGRRAGADDHRNQWPNTLRVIRLVGPRFIFLENVPGLLAHSYWGTILGGLAEAGYDAEWCVLGADDVGAPHRRKRLWVLGYALHGGRSSKSIESKRPILWEGPETPSGTSLRENCAWWDRDPADLADAEGKQDRGLQPRRLPPDASADGNEAREAAARPTESGMGRLVDGCPDRVDRLRALGNAQVPLVAATAWHILRDAIGKGT